MSFSLSKRTLDNLKGVHPDLVKVVVAAAALSPIPFDITEGLRTEDRQRQLLAQGKSQTMNSRHLTGKAVDFVALANGTVSWELPLYKQISDSFKRAATTLKIAIQWGGDWEHFKDSDHIELDSKSYP